MKEKNILIVEDDLEVCSLYNFFLKNEGYVLHEAHTGYEALSMLGIRVDNRENREVPPLPELPDLIILDMMLPVFDGYTIVHMLLNDRRLKNIPVIIVSARSSISNIYPACRNIRGFFTKPFDHNLITKRIKSLLKQSADP